VDNGTIENRAFTVWRKMLTFVGGLHESVAEEASKLRKELAGGSKAIQSSWIQLARR
jgi:translation initiation factor 1 (eIF-1/SUI1)